MIVVIFILGLIIGSFLNAVIHRLHSGQHIVSDRSKCVHCGHILSAWDLVPVISFIFLGGRCRYCKKKISWQYPLIELVTGLSFVLLAQNFSAGGGSAFGGQFTFLNFQFWMQAIFACFLIVIAVYDFKHYLILDKVVYPAIGLALIWSIANGYLISSLYGALIIAGFFALQYFISKGRWIGFGDVKFGIFLGLLFGIKTGIVMLVLAYFLGAIVGMTLIFLGRKQMGSKLPFGLFLSASAIITLLYGNQISSWYFSLIGL